jgi:outer membrane immunogenic protein
MVETNMRAAMPRVQFLFVIALPLTCAGSLAVAADLSNPLTNRQRDKETAVYSWTGLYVGAHSGYGASLLSGKGPLGSASGVLQGPLAGGQLGYNYQIDKWVLGVEGDISWSGSKADAPLPGGGNVSIKDNYFATAAARVGYALNRTLVFAKGGYLSTQESWNVSSGGKHPWGKFDRSGWMLGAGIEYALSHSWSAKFEYNYFNFPTIHETLTIGPLTPVVLGEVKSISHFGTVGLNYRF